MHIPLVLNDRHEKLSKQAGACPLEEDLMMELHQAWKHLRFDDIQAKSFSEFYDKATVFWHNRYCV